MARVALRFTAIWLVGFAVLASCEKDNPPVVDSDPPWFEEVSVEAGAVFDHRSGHRDRYLFPEIMGGGAAIADLDGDGLLDLYFVQSGDLLEPGSELGKNRLFLNRGQMRFADGSESSGADDPGYGMGVAAGDYDNDGRVDLYVTNVGANTLLRNEGGGRFTDVTLESGTGHEGWGVSAAFLDYDVDGDLDLFFANYVLWSLADDLRCYNSSGSEDYCNPNSFGTPASDVLYRNEGDGTFTDVSTEVGIRAARGNGLGVVALDFDDDGLLDLFVANDQSPNFLWTNLDGKAFREDALIVGCAVDANGQEKAGMGVDARDVDGDLDLDLLVVNLQAQSESFFRNRQGVFNDETGAMGLGAVSRAQTRFGIGWLDFDNDGVLDLYLAAGRVTLPETEVANGDPFAEGNLLMRGLVEGGYEPVAPPGGVLDRLVHTSRAAAFGDLDDDGGIDIVVVNRDAPAYLLRNVVAARGDWLGLRIVDRHGRDAIGARVDVETSAKIIRRDVQPAYSYLAANDPRIHIGLGEGVEILGVKIRWPDGVEEEFGPREKGRYSTLVRGES